MTNDNTSVVTVNNDALVAAGLAMPRTSLAPMREVARGKGTICVQDFAPAGTARDVKAALKAANPGVKSKALCRMVNETLRGERSLRNQIAAAFLQSRFESGDVASHAEVSANTTTIRLMHAPEPVKVAEPVKALEPSTAEEIKAAIEALTAKLNAIASK